MFMMANLFSLILKYSIAKKRNENLFIKTQIIIQNVYSIDLEMKRKISNPSTLQFLAYDAIDINIGLDLLENLIPRRIFIELLNYKIKKDEFYSCIEFNSIFDKDLINLDDKHEYRAFTVLKSIIFRNYFLDLLEPYYSEIKKYRLMVVHNGYTHQNIDFIEMCNVCYENNLTSQKKIYNYVSYNRILNINDLNEDICKNNKYWCKWCYINPLFYLCTV